MLLNQWRILSSEVRKSFPFLLRLNTPDLDWVSNYYCCTITRDITGTTKYNLPPNPVWNHSLSSKIIKSKLHNQWSANQKCRAAIFQRGGSSASRTPSLGIWTARSPPRKNQFIIFHAQPIRNVVEHISKEAVPVQAEPPPRKSRPSPKKQLFQGVKLKKNCPNFFCGSRIHIKNTFCKKNGSKRPFQPSAVVRAIYTRLYGVATAN